jgi:heme/copper-type cytochrome/quinol oxidase subunit 2
MARAQTQDEIRQPFWLWFGMIGAPIIWFVHFVIVWAIAEFGCAAGQASTVITGGSIQVLVIVATVVGVIGTLGSAFVAYRSWRQLERESADGGERRQGLQPFMAFMGMILGLLFTVVVILDVIPVFIVSTCGGVAGA